MSEFTKGKWEYREYVPEGITLNGIEYLISSDGEDVALARNEPDARLIAAAPELYELVMDELRGEAGGILSFAREAKIREVIDRIDGSKE